MGKDFRAIFWKDIRMLVSGKFFLLAMGALALYTLYVNFGYVRLVELSMYKVCLWDPQGICVDGSLLLQRASSREELDRMLFEDPDGVGIDLSRGKAEFLLYRSTPQVERYLEDYARSLLRPQEDFKAEVLGAFTTEEKQRREITCELLFFELSAVGFLGIAAVLFREKGMGVLRVHACLPVRGRLFLLSKLAVFLLSDLCFAILLTLLNVGVGPGLTILPDVLVETVILSLFMALIGLCCALFLQDFRQFTMIYLVIAVFVATPVFLSANTSVKAGWILFHPFYHLYMGMKNAFFGTPGESFFYYAGAAVGIGLLYMLTAAAFSREMRDAPGGLRYAGKDVEKREEG